MVGYSLLSFLGRTMGTETQPYIANDDPTGLSDLEIELIDGFMASTFPRGCSVDWDTCQEPHFSLSPEFGQPCEVYDAVMYAY